jgi:5-(carboxyamino)imidazole ribonucleotide synthase
MARVGVLGGGQLGRMLALAGYPLGLRFRFFDPDPQAPAGQVGQHIAADYEDEDALRRFAEGLDLITYEFENVPIPAVRFLQSLAPVFPTPEALEISQDRLREKMLFQSLGIPTAPFAAVNNQAELYAAAEQVGLAAILKTRRLGYDGKGQQVIQNHAALENAWRKGSPPSILEGLVPFERELSTVAVRGWNQRILFYPLVENHHREGMLRLSLAPAPDVEPRIATLAQIYTRKIFERLDYCGVMAIEWFVHEGRLIANEMAPRVHNSGHWTIDGAETSQFANHLRAVLGWPLGSTLPRGVSAMINLVGSIPDETSVLSIPGAHLHLYDKSPRSGRKIGHITMCANHERDLFDQLSKLHTCLPIPELRPAAWKNRKNQHAS